MVYDWEGHGLRLGGEVTVLIRDGQTDGAGIDEGKHEGTKKQRSAPTKKKHERVPTATFEIPGEINRMHQVIITYIVK